MSESFRAKHQMDKGKQVQENNATKKSEMVSMCMSTCKWFSGLLLHYDGTFLMILFIVDYLYFSYCNVVIKNKMQLH